MLWFEKLGTCRKKEGNLLWQKNNGSNFSANFSRLLISILRPSESQVMMSLYSAFYIEEDDRIKKALQNTSSIEKSL